MGNDFKWLGTFLFFRILTVVVTRMSHDPICLNHCSKPEGSLTYFLPYALARPSSRKCQYLRESSSSRKGHDASKLQSEKTLRGVVSQISLKTPRYYTGLIMLNVAKVVPVTQLLDNYFTIRASRVTANLFLLLPSRVV